VASPADFAKSGSAMADGRKWHEAFPLLLLEVAGSDVGHAQIFCFESHGAYATESQHRNEA
jgi:hypothetical protein